MPDSSTRAGREVCWRTASCSGGSNGNAVLCHSIHRTFVPHKICPILSASPPCADSASVKTQTTGAQVQGHSAVLRPASGTGCQTQSQMQKTLPLCDFDMLSRNPICFQLLSHPPASSSLITRSFSYISPYIPLLTVPSTHSSLSPQFPPASSPPSPDLFCHSPSCIHLLIPCLSSPSPDLFSNSPT